MAQIRFPVGLCPCGSDKEWKPVPSAPRNYRHCCGKARGVTGSTVFHLTSYSVCDLFYGMLIFANAHTGVPSTFLQTHFNLVTSSAFNFGHKIRTQMALIDRDRRIGGEGGDVEISTQLLGNVRSPNTRGRGTIRVVSVADDTCVLSCIVNTAERRTMLPFLRRVIVPGSCLVTRQENLISILRDKGRYRDFDDLTFRPAQSTLKEGIAMQFFNLFKRRGLRTYRSISRVHYWLYLKEFEFRFNRRNCQEQTFFDLISSFPCANRATIAALVEENNIGRKK